MNQDLIHVYFMPGMAASSKIFEYIVLPDNQFKIHYLEWMLPVNNESLSNYALRMVSEVKHENCVLIGVSFGGVLVQEMSKLVHFRKIIIISSIKSVNELPNKMQLAKVTKAYKLLPTQLVSNFDFLANYVLGDNMPKRLELYKKYFGLMTLPSASLYCVHGRCPGRQPRA